MRSFLKLPPNNEELAFLLTQLSLDNTVGIEACDGTVPVGFHTSDMSTVYDYTSIVSAITTLKPEHPPRGIILAPTTELQASVDGWVKYVEASIKPALRSKSTAKFSSVMSTLNAQLAKSTLIACEDITVADVLIFPLIHSILSERVTPCLPYNNLVRWFLFMQHRLRLDSSQILGLDVPEIEPEQGLPGTPSTQPSAVTSKPAKKKTKAAEVPPDPSVINVEIRVGTITSIEKHPNAENLFVEQVSFGSETRTIVSGLVKFYTAEQLLHTRAFFVLNLKPAKLKGVVSQGMILCAKDAAGAVEVVPVPINVDDGQVLSSQNLVPAPGFSQLSIDSAVWKAFAAIIFVKDFQVFLGDSNPVLINQKPVRTQLVADGLVG